MRIRDKYKVGVTHGHFEKDGPTLYIDGKVDTEESEGR